MNPNKNGIYMSTVTHQYALIGDTVFQFKEAVVHVSEPHGQSSSAAMAQTSVTQRSKNGRKLAHLSIDGRRSRVSSPVRVQRATNSSSFAISLLAAKMFTPMGTAEKTGESAIRPLAQTSGSQAFVPKQIVRNPNALNVATASSPS